MVVCYFGLPGSGKSTFMAKHYVKYHKYYDAVLTTDYVEGAYKLTIDMLGNVDIRRCLVLIDEATLLVDSRDFKKFTQQLKNFFLKHRHAKCDIIYYTQQYDGVDKKIRDITSLIYYVRKIGPFSYAIPIYRKIDVNDLTKEIVTGYQKGTFIDFIFGKFQFIFRPKYYKYFDSYEMEELPKVEFIPWSSEQ